MSALSFQILQTEWILGAFFVFLEECALGDDMHVPNVILLSQPLKVTNKMFEYINL